MDLATEAMMAEEVWCGGLSAVLVCFWPLFNCWRSLSPWQRGKMLLCVSTFIGMTDTGLDWYVLLGWYREGYWKIATALLSLILISGIFFAVLSHVNLDHSLEDTILMHCCGVRFIFTCLGFGNVIFALFMVCQSTPFEELYYGFHFGRSLEVFIEAAPGGALQLYYMIIMSVISIGVGVEESIGQFLGFSDRLLVFSFAASDFVFRVLSIVYFLEQYPLAEWIVVPAIYLIECVIWFKAFTVGNNSNCSGNSIVIALIFAIPSVCTSGLELFLEEFMFIFRRTYFLHFFLMRFVISCVLSMVGFIRTDNWIRFILMIGTAIVSLIGAIRVHFILHTVGESLSLNQDLMELKFKEDLNVMLSEYCVAGNVRLAKKMIRNGADMNSTDTNGETPAHKAAKSGKVEILRLLHQNGMDMNVASKNGDRPAHMVIYDGNLEVLRCLHEIGADMNAAGIASKAANFGKVEILRFLHDIGVDMNVADKNGRTLAHTAICYGKVESVRCLHECGVDMNVTDKDGWTPAHEAARSKTPAHWAAYMANIEVLRCLHEIEADMNAKDKNGETPAHRAVQSFRPGKAEALRVLIESRADMNATNKHGQTPVQMALCVSKRKGEVLRVLHESGVDMSIAAHEAERLGEWENMMILHNLMNASDKSGETPAHKAAYNEKVDANMVVNRQSGETRAHVAARCGEVERIRVLHEKGADMHVLDNAGETPAHKAAQNGEVEVLRFLHEIGADMNVANKDGETPAQQAAKKGIYVSKWQTFQISALLNQ